MPAGDWNDSLPRPLDSISSGTVEIRSPGCYGNVLEEQGDPTLLVEP